MQAKHSHWDTTARTKSEISMVMDFKTNFKCYFHLRRKKVYFVEFLIILKEVLK